MAYEGLFNALGLEDQCQSQSEGLPSLEALTAQTTGEEVAQEFLPFPSLDTLHEACEPVPRSYDFIEGVKNGFDYVKPTLRAILDPITEPLSWGLQASLAIFENTPWFIMIPFLCVISYFVTRSISVLLLVLCTLLFYAFVDIYDHAMQTLAIVLLCTIVSIIVGVPIGILMSKNNHVQNATLPILDLLQTLPSFVYLVPMIILFSATAPKLYGIAIILYAIVPVVRLTNLGIRLVNKDVIEAADAFGMTGRQKLFKVQLPLALPNIMAGVNQTIMMSLAMVVIASMVSAPGLGKYVLRAIRNIEIGYGIVYGIAIVLMAICLERVTKGALNRINVSTQ